MRSLLRYARVTLSLFRRDTHTNDPLAPASCGGILCRPAGDCSSYRAYLISSGSGPWQLKGFHRLQSSVVISDTTSQSAALKLSPTPPNITVRLIVAPCCQAP
jgi:hypothetical protein